MKNFIPYDEALKILKNSIPKWNRVEKVAITNALDRVLACDIVAKNDYPKFATSSMDGYACRSCDVFEGARLKVISDLPAGDNAKFILGTNECVKTFTGSLMSEGSDTLVPVENIERIDNEIIIKIPTKQGFAVRDIGESYKKGEILIKKGTKLSYAEIALLAELGEFHISVFIKPRVGILCSGNEIVDIGENIENDAQIRSSNHIALANILKGFGCDTILFEILKDDANKTQDAILNSLSCCDVLITTGGVSMGDYDFIKKTLRQEFEVLIDGVAIKPGRHIKIAKSGEKFLFAMPGFPYSCIVMTFIFVREFVNSLLNIEENYFFDAILEQDYIKKSPFLEFSPANINYKNGKIFINTYGKKNGSSAILNNLNKNSVLLVANIGDKILKSNEIVKVLKLL